MLAAVAMLCGSLPARAQSDLPELTGRVVDGAHLLPADRAAALEAQLKAHETRTSDQVVVATIVSLEGASVEDYANRLFRSWRLGKEQRNNGVLMLVALNDRKVRIEVGYGLEGVLTDATSSVIIQAAVTPRFKAGDYAVGIEAGVAAILSVISGEGEEWHPRPKLRLDEAISSPLAGFIAVCALLLAGLLFRLFRRAMDPPRWVRRGQRWVLARPGSKPKWKRTGASTSTTDRQSSGSSSSSSGSSSSSSDDDRFSGGGGSSGGGGASGSW